MIFDPTRHARREGDIPVDNEVKQEVTDNQDQKDPKDCDQ
jgi:hypothetical protein